jgi:hypothetical protein
MTELNFEPSAMWRSASSISGGVEPSVKAIETCFVGWPVFTAARLIEANFLVLQSFVDDDPVDFRFGMDFCPCFIPVCREPPSRMPLAHLGS